MAGNFLPTLSQSDIDRAAQLIQRAYAPTQAIVSSDDQQRLQQELFDIQKRPEAWGLVIPLLENQDPNVQFFGAHTAQVKIARDWDSFPQENTTQLRDLILELTVHSAVAGRNKVVLRKLFVALTSIALKLVPIHPSQWPDWLIACTTFFSGRGLVTEHILDFLSISAQEIDTADLFGPSKTLMQRSLLDAVPLVIQAITPCISRSRTGTSSELNSALKCLEAWIPVFPANDLTPLIPLLISLLTPTSDFDETTFVPASDALQEVMGKSALADGAGSATLTEPLLIWLETCGGKIVQDTIASGFVSTVSHSLCKLLVALGDHSTGYFAFNLATGVPATVAISPSTPPPPRSRLVQNFLKLLMSYTALPGYYGMDEEESEMTLGFWYLLQESLWSSDFYLDDDGGQVRDEGREKEVWAVAKAVYIELAQVLRRKVVWPEGLSGWAKDQRDRFTAYRRDVGDTLINAYYVLRDDMLGYYVTDILESLARRQETEGWAEIEATVHCIMCLQEAIPLEENIQLARVFGPEILGRLPTAGSNRVRRTTLVLIGTYASWFTVEPQSQSSPSTPLLMNAISYVVTALREPSLCFSAASALRDLCDANRVALAPHIGAFAELHANLTGIPDAERSKVLQSISSVIQALPPEEEIPPIEAIVSPVVQKLLQALQSSAQLPEEARSIAIVQLQTLTGVAKGLTRTADSLVIDDAPAEAEVERMNRAREDLRMLKLREAMFSAITNAVKLWSTDAGISNALSDLFKSATSLPPDTTLLSLPPGPLLELVCLASQRQLTAVWLSLASMLILQLDPPSLLPPTLKSGPSEEIQAIVAQVLPELLQTSLSSLGQPGAMDANPDIVQAFFGYMDMVAQHFTTAIYKLPPLLFNAMMQCSITALGLQERYSLVSACTFLAALITRTSSVDELADAKAHLVQNHGRLLLQSLLCGFAGVAPRSAVPNLIELLSTFMGRWPAEGKTWMAEIMFAEDFVQSKAGSDAKEKFIKAVIGSRSMKRTRDAAHQFTLVARGLEGSSFGYASVTM